LFAAGKTFQIVCKPFAAFTYPADRLGRVACHERVIRHVAGDHGAGAHKRVPADGDPADDGAVGAKGGAVFDKGGAHLVHLRGFSARVVYVGKHHGRAAEHVILKGYALVDGDVILDLAPFADDHVRADHDVLADAAVRPDAAAGENVAKVPDLCAGPD